jgi:hypothetical protein
MKIRKNKDRSNPFQKLIEPKVSSLHINGSIIHPTVQSMYSIQSRPWPDEAQKRGGGLKVRFHLHLLVFPFVYQFNSRIGVLVHSSFANDWFRAISTTF